MFHQVPIFCNVVAYVFSLFSSLYMTGMVPAPLHCMLTANLSLLPTVPLLLVGEQCKYLKLTETVLQGVGYTYSVVQWEKSEMSASHVPFASWEGQVAAAGSSRECRVTGHSGM